MIVSSSVKSTRRCCLTASSVTTGAAGATVRTGASIMRLLLDLGLGLCRGWCRRFVGRLFGPLLANRYRRGVAVDDLADRDLARVDTTIRHAIECFRDLCTHD